MAGFHFDPFSDSDPFASIVDIPELGGGRRRAGRPDFRQPLPYDEAMSTGKALLNAGTSGLGHVLGVLDKPGQAVRGVLAGHGLASLKHLVPFSDTTGLTTEKDHVRGRDLLNQWGVTSKRDKGWGAWGAGLATDIATDPLSYMTFGAKHAMTATGKALQKAGHLDGWGRKALLEGFDATESGLRAQGRKGRSINRMVDQGKRIARPEAEALGAKQGEALSGLANIGIPFGPKLTLGTGKGAQAVAGAFDTVGDKLKYGTAIGRGYNALFDPKVMGATGEAMQRGAAKYGHPELEAQQIAARRHIHDVISDLDPVIRANPNVPESVITSAARANAEQAANRFDPGIMADVDGVGRRINDNQDKYLLEAQKIGLPLQDAADPYIQNVHRQSVNVNHKSLQLSGKKQNLYAIASGSNMGRSPLYRGLPGGANSVDRWYNQFAGTVGEIDPALAGKGLKSARKANRKTLKANAQAINADIELDMLKSGRILNLTDDTAKAFAEKSKKLSSRISRADPKYATTPAGPGLPFYSPNLVASETQRAAQHARTMAYGKAAIGTIGDTAVAGGEVPVIKLLNKLGLDAGNRNEIGASTIEVLRGLARKGMPAVDRMKPELVYRHGMQMGVPADQAAQILKSYGKWTAPEQIKAPLKFYDSFTNLFKPLAYTVWLPSHVRNLVTALTNDATRGVRYGDLRDATHIMTGRGSRDLSGINPAFDALHPSARPAAIRREAYANANIFGGHNLGNDVSDAVQSLTTGGDRFTPNIPGSNLTGTHGNIPADAADLVFRQGLFNTIPAAGRAMRDSLGGLFNKNRSWGQGLNEHLGVAGVGGVTRDMNPAIEAGRVGGTNIENWVRMAQYLRESRNGASGLVAGREVNNLHFDYDHLTQFEKQVMRRAVPFYTFARKNLPLQMDRVIHQPGVFNAQYKPFFQQNEDERGYVPKYLSSGIAIPTGPEVDGKRQYISKLGLPAEEAFEKFHFQNGLPDTRATALDFMGNLNPLIKGPMEQLFGKQFHTQRELTDLRAPAAASAVGRLFGEDNPQRLSQLLANSPATRFVTSLDKIIDSRKGIVPKAANLLTGVRVTDVDAEKQRAIELRTTLEGIMRRQPHLAKYNSFFVRPEDYENLTPEETQLMRLYSGIQDASREYAKQHPRNVGVAPR